MNLNNYFSDFKKLPTNLEYAFDEPYDEIDVLNNLINQCISDHAPTKKVKFTRQPAPWMKDPEIISAKNHYENLQNTSRDSNHTERSAHQSFQAARNSYKKNRRSKKATFLRKALSSKSPREVWETVNRILDPPRNRIKHDPRDLNRYYTEIASTITHKENIGFNQLLLANILKELEKDNTFIIQNTTYTEVKNFISELRNDCSSGFDNIPVMFLKPVAE